MTGRADQRIFINASAHSTALVQGFFFFFFFFKASRHPELSAALQPRFGSLRLLAFPKAKIAVENEICECDGHTVHKLSQRCLTADCLAPRESDCSWMRSKVSSDWVPSNIKATRPVLGIFKMAGYFPDSPRKTRGINRNAYYIKNINQLSPSATVLNQSVRVWNIPVLV
jgi:hypothetical protein